MFMPAWLTTAKQGVNMLFVVIFIFGLLIIFASCKLCCINFFSKCFEQVPPVCAKFWFIIPYVGFTLGYFIYSINCYNQFYSKQHLGDLRDREADDLIEGLAKNVRNRHLSASYHIVNIVLMTISLAIFITSEVVDCIFNRGYSLSIVKADLPQLIILSLKSISFDKYKLSFS